VKTLIEALKTANSIVLCTHRQPDGDGLGCQTALYWALKKAGKKARILNVDELPKKYQFLNENRMIQAFEGAHDPLEKTDVALIFDTNDKTLLPGLWAELNRKCARVFFVDHHPGLKHSPVPEGSFIDITASSTGQIVFNIIKELGVPLDRHIARGIYTSIVFDTNNFRYIRNSPTPHLIAAELLRHDINPQEIHRRLFGNHTPAKIQFVSEMLGNVIYEFDGKLAWVRVKKAHMEQLGIELDETRDIIDMLMNLDSLEAAALFREDAPDYFKVSFRSKGTFPVNEIAISLGGGGHLYASGAYVKSSFEALRHKVLALFKDALEKSA